MIRKGKAKKPAAKPTPADHGVVVAAAAPTSAGGTSSAEATREQPSHWQVASRDGLRLARKNRRQLLPFAGIGATWASGAAVAAADSGVAVLAAAAGIGLAGAAYATLRAKLGALGRVNAAACSLCAAGYQVAAGVTDTGGGLPAAAMLGAGTLLSIPWWYTYSEADPDTEAERAAGLTPKPTAPQPQQLTDNPEDARAALYRKHINIGRLQPPARLDVGWRGVVRLDAPRHWSEVAAVRDKIASTFDLPDGRVYVDPLPGESVRTAQLTVITKDILPAGKRWAAPGLDPATGSFPVMIAADGSTQLFRLWQPGHGAKHALVSGTTGSGKSALLDLIFTEVAHASFYVPWLIDGGDGASCPAFTRSRAVPHVAITRDDALELLLYAVRVMKRRKRQLNRIRWTDPDGVERIGVSSVDPCPDMPGIAIVIDEAHNLLMGQENTRLRSLIEVIAKEGRKVGMSLILATQVPSAEELGGSTVLRNMLKAGTVIGLRTTESTAANMASSGRPLPELLHQLPEYFWEGGPTTEGLGYMLNAPRLIRARTLYQAEPHRWAASAELTELEVALRSVPLPVLGGDGAAAPEQPGATGFAEPTRDLSTVEAALIAAHQAGCPWTVPDLVAATRLPMSAVRAAINAQG